MDKGNVYLLVIATENLWCFCVRMLDTWEVQENSVTEPKKRHSLQVTHHQDKTDKRRILN